MFRAWFAAYAAVALAAPAVAEEPSNEPRNSADVDRARLEEEIRNGLGGTPPKPSARGAPAAAPDTAAAAQAPPGGQGPTGGNALARLLLLPDVSAIASFTGVYDDYDVATLSPDRCELYGPKGQPTFLLQEVELGLQAVVDPYFRGDIFVSFSPSGVDVEEAYATTLALPANLQVRAGQSSRRSAG